MTRRVVGSRLRDFRGPLMRRQSSVRNCNASTYAPCCGRRAGRAASAGGHAALRHRSRRRRRPPLMPGEMRSPERWSPTPSRPTPIRRCCGAWRPRASDSRSSGRSSWRSPCAPAARPNGSWSTASDRPMPTSPRRWQPAPSSTPSRSVRSRRWSRRGVRVGSACGSTRASTPTRIRTWPPAARTPSSGSRWTSCRRRSSFSDRPASGRGRSARTSARRSPIRSRSGGSPSSCARLADESGAERIDLGGGFAGSPAEWAADDPAASARSGAPDRRAGTQHRRATAGWLLTRVVRVQARGHLIADAGMTELLRPDALRRPPSGDGPRARRPASVRRPRLDVVGSHLRGGRRAGAGTSPRRSGEGALLAIGEAGAYGAAMASNYNGQPASGAGGDRGRGAAAQPASGDARRRDRPRRRGLARSADGAMGWRRRAPAARPINAPTMPQRCRSETAEGRWRSYDIRPGPSERGLATTRPIACRAC